MLIIKQLIKLYTDEINYDSVYMLISLVKNVHCIYDAYDTFDVAYSNIDSCLVVLVNYSKNKKCYDNFTSELDQKIKTIDFEKTAQKPIVSAINPVVLYVFIHNKNNEYKCINGEKLSKRNCRKQTRRFIFFKSKKYKESLKNTKS